MSSNINVRTPVSCTLPHRALVLPNGATIISIQDTDCTMPAAAMTVGVGHLCDPPEFPGLAHFCEHMLFMGTDKFPGEDAYETAVSRAGGHTNAWTASDSTTYYFTSNTTQFMNIIPMFLDFFISPLFSPSGVERELQAVHSEDEKNHAIDYWRVNELLHSFIVPEHPAFRYGNGNLTTLKEEPTAKGLDIVAALRTFFNQHYTAEAMCLAVYSPYDAETIFELASKVLGDARPAASPIRALKALEGDFPASTSIIDPTSQKKWYNVTSMSKVPSVQVMWVLNGVGTASFKTAPSMWISSVLGHEVKGSIAATIREMGWGTDLVGGTGSALDSCHTTFYLKVSLTDEGLKRVSDVVALIYQKIQFLKNLGSIPIESYEEVKTEHRIGFEFSDVRRAEDHVAHVSSQAIKFGVENAICGASILHEDDRKGGFDVLEQLSPTTGVVLLHIGSPKDLAEASIEAPNGFFGDVSGFLGGEGENDASTQRVTRFHKMVYSEAPIPDVLLSKWANFAASDIHPSFCLPTTNPFLAEDYTIYPRINPNESPEMAATPETIRTKYGTTYLKQSTCGTLRFSPKLSARLSFIAPHVFATPDKMEPVDAFYLRLLPEILKESIVDVTYFAELASISGSISGSLGGLLLAASGPSSNLPDYVVQLTKLIFIPQANSGKLIAEGTPELFATHKGKLARQLQSICEKQPLQIVSTDTSFATDTNLHVNWEEELELGVPAATYNGYTAFLKRFVSQLHFEILINGNIKDYADIKSRVVDAVEATLEEGGIGVANKEEVPHYRSFYRLPLPPADLNGSSTHFFNLVSRNALSSTNVNASVSARFEIAYLDEHGTADQFRECLVAECLGKLISSPFFNTLRTTEALGYMVSAQMTNHLSRVMFLQFGVQSAVAGPWYLLSRVSAFIDAYETQALPKLSQADVDGVVNAMVESLRQPPMSVSQENGRLFSKRVHPRGFTASIEAASILESKPITIDEIRNLFALKVSNNHNAVVTSQRRNITVAISSDVMKAKDASGEFVAESGRAFGDLQGGCRFPTARSDVGSASSEDDTKLIMKRFSGDVPDKEATPFVVLFSKSSDIRTLCEFKDVSF